MNRSPWRLCCLVIGLIGLLTGCGAFLDTPDWEELYEQKLGQPLTDIHETSLNEEFTDNNGYQTRVSWAHLEDGTSVFLGVPSHDNSPDKVVDWTVVLHEEEWHEACQTAVGQEITAWLWSGASGMVSNYMDVHVSTKKNHDEVSVPDPDEPTCRFTFRTDGWHLELIYNEGKVST